MQCWWVMYWLDDQHPASWPENYGYVPGKDWHEARENALSMWPDAWTIWARPIEELAT